MPRVRERKHYDRGRPHNGRIPLQVPIVWLLWVSTGNRGRGACGVGEGLVMTEMERMRLFYWGARINDKATVHLFSFDDDAAACAHARAGTLVELVDVYRRTDLCTLCYQKASSTIAARDKRNSKRAGRR